METCQAFSRNSKKARVARVQWAREQVVRVEAGESWESEARQSDGPWQ